MNDAIKQALCLAIADGMTVRQFCAQPDMPAPSTVYLALANDEVFSDQYARAREAQLARWEDELIEIADDGTNDWITRQQGEETIEVANHEHISRSKLRADTRKWIMSKRLPKKYGDKLTQELTGKDGGAIQVHRVERIIVDPTNTNG